PAGDVGFVGPLGMDKSDLFRMAEMAVLAVVGILVLLLVVRPLMTRLFDGAPTAAADPLEGQLALAGQSQALPALPGPALGEHDGLEEPERSEESMIDVKQIEGRVKASSVKRVGEIIERHPDDAV